MTFRRLLLHPLPAIAAAVGVLMALGGDLLWGGG
jgi:hypothetical protein